MNSSPFRPVFWAISCNSAGVWREYFPRPPQMYMPRSFARGFSPLLRAYITDVVMPELCQSIPMTAPRLWNQRGSLSRTKTSSVPKFWMSDSVINVPITIILSASQRGTVPPCNGKSACPAFFILL